MIALNNILVATDFSAPSDAALVYGRALARTFGATLHVLHAVDDLYLRLAGEAYVATIPEVQKDLEKLARKRLDDLLIDDDPAPLPTKPVVLTSSAPAPVIVDYAAEAHIDLIVVGTHGRSGMAHLLLGGVAERVVRTAPCPVLTVRHREREIVTPDSSATTRA